MTYDGDQDSYTLPAEHAFILADESSPVAMAGIFQAATAVMDSRTRVAERFRTGEGVGWHEHHDGLFRGTERRLRLLVTATPRRPGRAFVSPSVCVAFPLTALLSAASGSVASSADHAIVAVALVANRRVEPGTRETPRSVESRHSRRDRAASSASVSDRRGGYLSSSAIVPAARAAPSLATGR